MKRDALQDPTQVRLPRALKERLTNAAAQFGLTSSELIRRALEWKLPDWESTGVLTIHSSPAPVSPSRVKHARATVAAAAIAACLAYLACSQPQIDSGDQPIICAGE